MFKAMEEYVISYTKNFGFIGDFLISYKPVAVGASRVDGRTGIETFPSSHFQLTYPNITAMAFAGKTRFC